MEERYKWDQVGENTYRRTDENGETDYTPGSIIRRTITQRYLITTLPDLTPGERCSGEDLLEREKELVAAGVEFAVWGLVSAPQEGHKGFTRTMATRAALDALADPECEESGEGG